MSASGSEESQQEVSFFDNDVFVSDDQPGPKASASENAEVKQPEFEETDIMPTPARSSHGARVTLNGGSGPTPSRASVVTSGGGRLSAALHVSTPMTTTSTMLNGVLSPSEVSAETLVDPTIRPHNFVATHDTLMQTFWELRSKKNSILASRRQLDESQDEESTERRQLLDQELDDYQIECRSFQANWAQYKRMVASISLPLLNSGDGTG